MGDLDETQERIRRVEAGLLPDRVLEAEEPAPASLADRMKALRVPGVSLAVIHGGRIAWAKGYGLKETGRPDPVLPETLFQAASISKPVAVAAGLRLVQEGLLDLDEDINRYLTAWQVPANGSWQPRITLRQLMSHTAGLTVHGFPGYHRAAAVPTLLQVLNGEYPANTPPVQVNIMPGVQFRYSGGGTTVLQQLLVDVTGTPFPSLMRELVLSPLGMNSSTYEQPLPAEKREFAATGHGYGNLEPVDGKWHIYPEMAAAGLWTTPTDLALFALEIQRAHAGESRLFRQETAAEMLRIQGDPEMGLGVFLRSSGENLRLEHGGSNHGYKNMLVAYPGQGMGAVVMTNADAGITLRHEILRAIAATFGWPGYLPDERAEAELDDPATGGLAGEWELRPGFTLRISGENGALWLQPPGQEPVRLCPASATRFFARELNLELIRGESGDLKLKQNGREFPLKRVD